MHRLLRAMLVVLSAVAGSFVLAPGNCGATEPPVVIYGGSPKREIAKPLSLEWLIRVQDAETGAWSLTGKEPRSRYADGAARENRCQATALALLALQGAGHTPARGYSKKTVAHGWEFLLKQQRPEGWIADPDGHEPFITHAQCMLVLCELFAMTKDPRLKDPAERAIAFACRTQHKQGGWGAKQRQDGTSDDSQTATTCWMLMALQSARLARLDVPPEAFAGVTRYLNEVQSADGTRYRASPQPKSPATDALTAQAILARIYLGTSRRDPQFLAGVRGIQQIPPSEDEPDVTYWFFATQVMHHLEGIYSDRWNPEMREVLIENQRIGGREAGSWPPLWPKPDKIGIERGRLYETCLATATLSVYYRHLPIYAKHQIVGKADANEFAAKSTTVNAVGSIFGIFARAPEHTASDALRKLGGESVLAEQLGSKLLFALDDSYQGIKRLNLAGSKITPAGLAELAKLPMLEHLNLDATQVTDESLRVLEKHEKLRSLSLGDTRATGAGLAHFAGLDQISLPGSQVNDAALQGYPKLARLETLDLSRTKITDLGLAELKGLRRIKSLKLDQSAITDRGLEVVETFRRLHSLSLHGTRVGDAGVGRLANLQRITSLDLTGTQVTDTGIAAIQNLDVLRYLELSGTRVTGAGLGVFKELHSVNLDSTPLSESGLAELAGLQRLVNVSLRGVELTDGDLAKFSSIAGLGTLHLDRTKITDAGLAHLESAEYLSELTLDGTAITDAGLAQLKNLKFLELALNDTPVTNQGIAMLSKGLRHLNLANTKVSGTGLREFKELLELDLSGTPFSDAEIGELRGLPLYELDLSRTKITDAAVPGLLELPNLWSLRLDETQVSKEGRAKLAKILAPAKSP